MSAEEIVKRLNAGNVVTIRASDAMEFMRECERRLVTGFVVEMDFVGNRCVMQVPGSEHESH